MHVGKTLFAQVMEFVPWTSFERIVHRHGGKDIENRCWPTKFRGRILIHAAKGCTRDELEDALDFAKAAVVVPSVEDAFDAHAEEVSFVRPNGKRLSDAPPKLARRTGAGGVG